VKLKPHEIAAAMDTEEEERHDCQPNDPRAVQLLLLGLLAVALGVGAFCLVLP
jgi:hypothetical protein